MIGVDGTSQTRGSAQPIRVVVAGTEGAPLTMAAIDALGRDDRVSVVGVFLGRIDGKQLHDLEPDVLISAAHAFRIPMRNLGSARLGAVGLHPSLLPAYRGSYPLWWALRHNEQHTGLSLYRLVEAIDAGPILDQTEVAIAPDDTFSSLYERVADEVRPMLARFIERVSMDGAIPAGIPQPEPARPWYPAPARVERLVMRVWWAVRRQRHRLLARG